MLGSDSVEQILIYYPEMKMQKADGKEETEFANKYFIMHKKATEKTAMEKEKYMHSIVICSSLNCSYCCCVSLLCLQFMITCYTGTVYT